MSWEKCLEGCQAGHACQMSCPILYACEKLTPSLRLSGLFVLTILWSSIPNTEQVGTATQETQPSPGVITIPKDQPLLLACLERGPCYLPQQLQPCGGPLMVGLKKMPMKEMTETGCTLLTPKP